MPLTLSDVIKLDGQDLVDAVVQQVLGWTRAASVAVDSGISVTDAWLEKNGTAYTVRPRSVAIDLTSGDWPVRILARMADLGKQGTILLQAGPAYSVAFAVPGAAKAAVDAVTVTLGSMAWAIVRASLLAVQS